MYGSFAKSFFWRNTTKLKIINEVNFTSVSPRASYIIKLNSLTARSLHHKGEPKSKIGEDKSRLHLGKLKKRRQDVV